MQFTHNPNAMHRCLVASLISANAPVVHSSSVEFSFKNDPEDVELSLLSLSERFAFNRGTMASVLDVASMLSLAVTGAAVVEV